MQLKIYFCLFIGDSICEGHRPMENMANLVSHFIYYKRYASKAFSEISLLEMRDVYSQNIYNLRGVNGENGPHYFGF